MYQALKEERLSLAGHPQCAALRHFRQVGDTGLEPAQSASRIVAGKPVLELMHETAFQIAAAETRLQLLFTDGS